MYEALATDVAFCLGRIISHLELPGPVSTIVATGTCLQTRRTPYAVLVGLRTFFSFVFLHNYVKRTLYIVNTDRIMFITIYENSAMFNRADT